MDFLSGFPLFRFGFKLIGYMNAADNQHLTVFFDLPPCL
jgi:hypothetical protein